MPIASKRPPIRLPLPKLQKGESLKTWQRWRRRLEREVEARTGKIDITRASLIATAVRLQLLAMRSERMLADRDDLSVEHQIALTDRIASMHRDANKVLAQLGLDDPNAKTPTWA